MPHQYRRAGANRATLRAEWRRAKRALRFCASCGVSFQPGEPIVRGEVYLAEGVVLYSNHRACDDRLLRDGRALDRFLHDAYRALYGAGPDDVGGIA